MRQPPSASCLLDSEGVLALGDLGAGGLVRINGERSRWPATSLCMEGLWIGIHVMLW
jgi:hypothetical protein